MEERENLISRVTTESQVRVNGVLSENEETTLKAQ